MWFLHQTSYLKIPHKCNLYIRRYYAVSCSLRRDWGLCFLYITTICLPERTCTYPNRRAGGQGDMLSFTSLFCFCKYLILSLLSSLSLCFSSSSPSRWLIFDLILQLSFSFIYPAVYQYTIRELVGVVGVVCFVCEQNQWITFNWNFERYPFCLWLQFCLLQWNHLSVIGRRDII